MIPLLILICVLVTIVALLTLRRPHQLIVDGPPLFLSCSRPSERKELGCWLFTISIWNRSGDDVVIERMEVILPSGVVIPVQTPPQDHPRAAIFHHVLHFPLSLPPAASAIVIAAAVPEPTDAFAAPGQCRLRAYAGDSVAEYPLFRTSFS